VDFRVKITKMKPVAETPEEAAGPVAATDIDKIPAVDFLLLPYLAGG